jgi:hypothetical protein
LAAMTISRFFRTALTLAALTGAAVLLARRPWAGRASLTSLPRGTRVGRIERCALHGISYDRDNEVCPACASDAVR